MLFLATLFAVLLAFAALFAAVAMRHGTRRRDALARIAAHVGGTHDISMVWGMLHGVGLRLNLTSRGRGSNRKAWTEIDVVLTAPFALYVRRRCVVDPGPFERDDTVEVTLGEPAFDEAFLVAAVPPEVAARLLDAELRSVLARHDHATLVTVDVEGRRVLRLAMRGWLDDVARATAALDAMAHVGMRMQLARN